MKPVFTVTVSILLHLCLGQTERARLNALTPATTVASVTTSARSTTTTSPRTTTIGTTTSTAVLTLPAPAPPTKDPITIQLEEEFNRRMKNKQTDLRTVQNKPVAVLPPSKEPAERQSECVKNITAALAALEQTLSALFKAEVKKLEERVDVGETRLRTLAEHNFALTEYDFNITWTYLENVGKSPVRNSPIPAPLRGDRRKRSADSYKAQPLAGSPYIDRNITCPTGQVCEAAEVPAHDGHCWVYSGADCSPPCSMAKCELRWMRVTQLTCMVYFCTPSPPPAPSQVLETAIAVGGSALGLGLIVAVAVLMYRFSPARCPFGAPIQPQLRQQSVERHGPDHAFLLALRGVGVSIDALAATYRQVSETSRQCAAAALDRLESRPINDYPYEEVPLHTSEPFNSTAVAV